MGQRIAHAVERLAVDAQDLGCLRDIALRVREHPQDVAALQLVEAGQIVHHRTAGGRRRSLGQQQVAGIDDRIGGQRQRSFDQVLQLADVARERIAEQFLQRFLGDAYVAQPFALPMLLAVNTFALLAIEQLGGIPEWIKSAVALLLGF